MDPAKPPGWLDPWNRASLAYLSHLAPLSSAHKPLIFNNIPAFTAKSFVFRKIPASPQFSTGSGLCFQQNSGFEGSKKKNAFFAFLRLPFLFSQSPFSRASKPRHERRPDRLATKLAYHKSAGLSRLPARSLTALPRRRDAPAWCGRRQPGLRSCPFRFSGIE